MIVIVITGMKKGCFPEPGGTAHSKDEAQRIAKGLAEEGYRPVFSVDGRAFNYFAELEKYLDGLDSQTKRTKEIFDLDQKTGGVASF